MSIVYLHFHQLLKGCKVLMGNMKVLALCLVYHCISIFQSVISPTNYLNSKSAVRHIVLENSLLWKIEKNDRPPSYLFGTFHLLPLEDFEISDKVLTAFELSDQIVFELDLDDPDMHKSFMVHVKRADTLTLQNSMSPRDYIKLDEMLMDAFGMGVDAYNHWHPAIVGTFLIKHYIQGAPASYDASLLELANQKNREVLGLETIEEQLNIFNQIPYEDQIKDLEEMLNEEAKVKSIFSDMIAMYKVENIDGLHNLFMEYNKNKQKTELLLNNRNRNWKEKIDSLTKHNSTFVAVGAGHLAGRYGVINLLRQEGFTVTPVE